MDELREKSERKRLTRRLAKVNESAKAKKHEAKFLRESDLISLDTISTLVDIVSEGEWLKGNS